MSYCRINGVGFYLPQKILSNYDLEKMVDTSDEWIRKRTGIQNRHIASENELPSDMALKASEQALKQSKLLPKDLDLILVATVYPDQIMPNTACELQRKLGIFETPSLDISAACSGFIYGYSIASQYIKTGASKNILLVGTETLHHITNYEDRSTCILFGDGAGAFVLSASQNPKTGCIHHQELKAYGDLGYLIRVPSPGACYASQNPTNFDKKENYIQMDGHKVFKHAVRMMSLAYQKTLEDTGHKPTEIDWIVPHQANERILNSFCEVTHFPKEKVIFDIKDTGNTSSASIPISFARAVQSGKIQRGQNVLLLAVGGGLTSGSLFIRY